MTVARSRVAAVAAALVLAAVAIVLVVTVTGGDEDILANGRSASGPLQMPNTHGYTTSVKTGDVITDGFEVLHLTGSRKATIDDVRLPDAKGFELLGVKLSSPDRPIGSVQITRNWPPVDPQLPPETITDAIGATITPHDDGWELLIGMKITGSGYLIRDGLIIDYTVDGRGYTARFPSQVVVCTDASVENKQGRCPAPKNS